MSVMDRSADIVGCYTVAGKTHFYGVTLDELDRSAFAMVRVLRSFGLAPGGIVLTVSLTQEVVQFAPFERAIQSIGLFGINSDLSPYDAGRVESIMRQFDPGAICGVGTETLEGLKMFGHDPAAVFRGRLVWARPDAYAAVAALGGVLARRCALLGPALALECADGGLHVDGQEWIVSEEGGKLSIQSRTLRATPLPGLDTGIAGTVPDRPCSCGNRDPFVKLG
jgi:hypothetical protein